MTDAHNYFLHTLLMVQTLHGEEAGRLSRAVQSEDQGLMRNTTLSLDVLHVCYMRETVRWRTILPSFPTANLEVRVVIPRG